MISRWDFPDLSSLRREFDRIFSSFPQEGALVPRRWAPVSDVFEHADEVVITAELPGVKDEDVEITVEDGMLRIAGERSLEEEVREESRYRLERSYGSFERHFPLPPGVTESDIHASIAYGVLRVRIPKPRPAAARRIPIQGRGAS